MATITVVITSYNYGMYLAQALDSVLSQTRRPEAILVVDDGSHDMTFEVAKKFGVDCIIRQDNLGVVDNLNDILYNHVNTDKMMHLGADDYLRPDALELMDLPYDIVYSDLAYFGPLAHKVPMGAKTEYKDGYWLKRFTKDWRHILTGNCIHGSSLFDVKMARAVGGYKAKKNRGARLEEDWYLFGEMIKAGAIAYRVPEPLLFYRKHRFNINDIKINAARNNRHLNGDLQSAPFVKGDDPGLRDQA